MARNRRAACLARQSATDHTTCSRNYTCAHPAADFLKSHYWCLRGKLDVPKERFLAPPGCERDADRTPVVGWAGWDHLQQAQALATYYVAMKDQEGWPPVRLAPLLAAVQELLPWLEQWHNALDPTYGQEMGDYYRGFVEVEARELGFTLEALKAWKPPAARRGGRPKKPAE